jgi:hypothetical protein
VILATISIILDFFARVLLAVRFNQSIKTIIQDWRKMASVNGILERNNGVFDEKRCKKATERL